jgi:hypothetical protein
MGLVHDEQCVETTLAELPVADRDQLLDRSRRATVEAAARHSTKYGESPCPGQITVHWIGQQRPF